MSTKREEFEALLYELRVACFSPNDGGEEEEIESQLLAAYDAAKPTITRAALLRSLDTCAVQWPLSIQRMWTLDEIVAALRDLGLEVGE